MNKVASENVLAVLRAAGPTLRKLASENQRLQAENGRMRRVIEQKELAERVEKVASEAFAKDLSLGTFDETRAFFAKKAAEGQLSEWEKATKLAARRFDLGQPGSTQNGGSALERFLLEGEV
jgi:hypothetical protein